MLGVKVTLKKVAVKFELSWHRFRALDSMSLIADTSGVARKATNKLMISDINRMVAGLCRAVFLHSTAGKKFVDGGENRAQSKG